MRKTNNECGSSWTDGNAEEGKARMGWNCDGMGGEWTEYVDCSIALEGSGA
jgi:hypothetical protein